MHPLRKAGFVNAFSEGWAKYSATFAGEIGMYQEPAEKFDRMMMDSFLYRFEARRATASCGQGKVKAAIDRLLAHEA